MLGHLLVAAMAAAGSPLVAPELRVGAARLLAGCSGCCGAAEQLGAVPAAVTYPLMLSFMQEFINDLFSPASDHSSTADPLMCPGHSVCLGVAATPTVDFWPEICKLNWRCVTTAVPVTHPQLSFISESWDPLRNHPPAGAVKAESVP